MSTSKKTYTPKKPKKQSVPGQKGRVAGLVGRIFAGAFLVMVISGCIVLSVLTVYVLNLISTESEFDLRRLELNYTTILYANDENGEPYELDRIYGAENRIWVDYEQMPQHLLDAAVAGEDKRFYTHNGVDWVRTVKAFLTFMQPGGSVQGGSTITQQLIKNISGDDKVTIDRKVKEIFRAIKMNNAYTKEEVLEAYLNTIHLGNNTNGVQAAANLYFDKDVSELSIAESAALVAITQYPIYYDLFKNPENNKIRQTYILDQMLDQGMITQKEYDDAINEELQIATVKAEEAANKTQSWFVDNLIEEVVEDLVNEKGYEEAAAFKLLTTGGLHIYTTVDEEMQNYLEEKFADDSTFPTVTKVTDEGTSEEQPQAAMVIMDLEGNIKAMAGGRGEKTQARLYNRATMAKRQPGSSIKPIASYAQAVDMDMITFSSIIPDQKVSIGSWSPQNYYSGYLGPITVDEALQRSTNTVAVQIMQKLTPQVCFDFLTGKLGFTSLVEYREQDGTAYSDIGPAAMSIGALTDGVTVLEMTAAYQMFGNGGFYYSPRSYTEIRDSDGNIVLEKKSVPVRAISSDTATVMNKLLQNVVRGPYGTGSSAQLSNMPVAGKTGTSDEDFDQWFVGVTPYYVAAVWQGYDRSATIDYYSYPPPIIWKNVMGPIHSDLEYKSFPYDSSVVQKTYCTVSGDLATEKCEKTAMGYYKQSNIPPTCTQCTGEKDDEYDSQVVESTSIASSSESSSEPPSSSSSSSQESSSEPSSSSSSQESSSSESSSETEES